MEDGPLKIVAADEGDGRRLTLTGEATIYVAAPAKAWLMTELEATRTLGLDLSGVHEVDTTFIQLLLLLRREAERTDKVVQLLNPSRPIAQLIELYGLEARLLERGEEGA